MKQATGTDIFLWGNQLDGMKRELNIELFLFSKNYTPYTIRYSAALAQELSPVFMYDLIHAINTAAAAGGSTAELEEYDKDRHMIAHTPIAKVGRAETLIHLIENERKDIVEFNNDEHEFKRMIGVVARFTHPVDKKVLFHVVKQLPNTKAVTGRTAWQINDGQFEPMAPDVSLNIPTDNQMLVVAGDMFIFNVAKFTKLFNYDVQQIMASDEKGAAIAKQYKLNLPDFFNDFAVMAREKKTTLKKLLDVDLNRLPSQDTVLEAADEMAIEIMTDDAGAIILFDSKDVGIFLDLINENYLSSTTGRHYLAKSKKPLVEDDAAKV